MDLAAILMGAASLAGVMLARRSGCPASVTCALMLTTCWAGANTLAVMGLIDALALIDLPIALGVLAAWQVRRDTWLAVLSAVFAARLGLHVAGVWGLMPWMTYLHTINALFVTAVVCVGWKGGIGDGVVSLLRGLRDVRGVLSRTEAGQ